MLRFSKTTNHKDGLSAICTETVIRTSILEMSQINSVQERKERCVQHLTHIANEQEVLKTNINRERDWQG